MCYVYVCVYSELRRKTCGRREELESEEEDVEVGEQEREEEDEEKEDEEEEETLGFLYLSITLYFVMRSPLSCGCVQDNILALSEMFGALGTPATV